jgi:serine/threonine protein kinase
MTNDDCNATAGEKWQSTEFSSWEKLVKGSFSTVYKAWHKPTSKWYAIKVLPNSTRRQMRDAKKEIYLHSLLQHRYVLKLHGHFYHRDSVYLVYDYYREGDLWVNMPIPVGKIPIYTRQLTEVIQYCHAKGVVHRDIKPENILVSDDHRHIVLCDFGLAQKVNPDHTATTKLRSRVGTPRFVAPEVLRTKDPKHWYTAACDIWSLGGVVADMCFDGSSDDHAKDRCAKGYDTKNTKDCFLALSQLSPADKNKWPQTPTPIPLPCKDLICKCLQINPEDRPTLDALLQHPFLPLVC